LLLLLDIGYSGASPTSTRTTQWLQLGHDFGLVAFAVAVAVVSNLIVAVFH
jgi:hypothetical protein